MSGNIAEVGRKTVIVSAIIGVVVIFVSSFVYRMNNPNLFKQVRTEQAQRPPASQEHGDAPAPPSGMGEMGGSMAKVREYMARVGENPEDVEALVGLGNAFLMMRAWDRALDPLEKANALKPGDPNLLKAIGIAQFNLQAFDKAAAAYEGILEMNPEDPLALFNLGVINKYYFENNAQARIYFEKILVVKNDDSEITKMAKQELAE